MNLKTLAKNKKVIKMKDISKVSPLKILKGPEGKELGKGNMGVLIARAGLGKTSCLIHIAFDKLLDSEKLIHVSLKDSPDKVTSYYNVIFYELIKALKKENGAELRTLLDKNRIILSYLKESFDLDRLKVNLRNLAQETNFKPDTLIIDDINFSETKREIFEGFLDIAKEFQVEIWFSAISHRHITDVNEKGVPFPCNDLDDLFSIIIQLYSSEKGVFLKLLKEREDKSAPEIAVKLNPKTFLAME